MNIGFIGIGKMGAGMARNLLRARHTVIVYNRSREKTEALASDGAQIANSVAEASGECEAVITMLADDSAVADVVFGPGGIISALKTNCIHISGSTISVALARRLAAEHADREQLFVSGPVFGRPEAAEAKKLLVLAAGADTALHRCRPLLDAMGRGTIVIGPEPWQANLVKLCGNFMIAGMLEAFGEAFASVRKAGMDRHVFLDVANELFSSPMYKNYGSIVADERFDPAAFTLNLGLKDIRLVLEAAEQFAVAMPLASLIRDHAISGIAQGQKDLDWASLARVVARNAGLES